MASTPWRRVLTTDSAHAHAVAPNLIGRRFTVPEVEGLDRVWARDISYIPTAADCPHLATVLDLGARRAVGWATRDTW